MRRFLNKILVSIAFVFSVVFSAKSVTASTPLINSNLIKDSILDLKKIDPWTIKCSIIESLAKSKLAKFIENKNKHFGTYIEFTSRLSEKIDNWEKLGFETTKLQEDLKVMKNKVAKFETDFSTYQLKLDAIKSIDCDNTSADYDSTLKDLKNALKEVRKDVVDIRTYYQTQIRPDIMDLKKQLIPTTEE